MPFSFQFPRRNRTASASGTHTDNHRTTHRCIILILSSLVLGLWSAGISQVYPLYNIAYRTKQIDTIKHTDSFPEFADALFCYEVTSDSVTSAYTLKNPSAYDIPKLSPLLSSFSGSDYDKSRATQENLLELLQKRAADFDKNELTEAERLTNTLLADSLSLQDKLNDYPYYEELLGASTGIAANLPVTLGEYPFYNLEDIHTYLTLLTQLPKYFNQVISYETRREQAGYTTPEFSKAATKKALETMLNGFENGDNSFIDTFDERVCHMDSLTARQKKKLREKNRKYVDRYVIPSYRKLLDYVSANVTENDSEIARDVAYGISSLPDGKAYYSLLAQRATGSARTPEELIRMTEQTLSDTLGDILNIALTNQDDYIYYCNNHLESYYESPDNTLDALSLMIREDYPALRKSPEYAIKTVSKSLAPSLSPAFFMIPAIDDYQNNTIYINPLYTGNEQGNLFTTLAHEGFPGHLYQTVFFNETKPLPIRQILNYAGYVEGWATYVELNSFRYLDYPMDKEVLSRLYQADIIISLALSTRIDLGVNYEGWTLADVESFFERNGFKSYFAKNLYSYVVEAPANYLSYFIGYLEIENIKNEYKKLTMDNYSEKDFHARVLTVGPCDFDTLKEYVLKQ